MLFRSRDMVGIGILVPDDGLEDYAREIGGLPERTADTRTDDPRRTKQQNQSQPPEKDSGKEKNDELPEDDIKAAKSRLGREK